MKTSFANFSGALGALLASICLAAAVSAADQKAAVNRDDEKFIKSIAADGLTDIKLAELAVLKASKPEVKELARMLATEHTGVNDSVKALAESKKVMLSAIIEPSGAAAFQRLEKFFGDGFDKEFLNHMQLSHERTVAAFERASEDAKDAELKVFIEKTLPTLRAHLDEIKKLLPPAEPAPIPVGP